jgi:4-hydroxy-tetrahydrodipicolinate synthase
MGVALITPFKENEQVDHDALIRMIDHLVENGTDYIVALGTTAETPSLSEEEKKEITRIIVERVARRIPIVLGVGGNCTRNVIARIEQTDFHGIDAILSVVPYYNKPSQEGLYRHFSAIADASPRPVVLYNVPGRTGTNMLAATTLRLARECERFAAIKEASGNMAQIDDLIRNKPADFQVISGDDGITFPLIALGATGVISVIGNAFPEDFGRMVRLALQGDCQNARLIHARFAELFELLATDGNPAGIKSLLNMMGFIENRLRLPLVPARPATREKMRDALARLYA